MATIEQRIADLEVLLFEAETGLHESNRPAREVVYRRARATIAGEDPSREDKKALADLEDDEGWPGVEPKKTRG